MSEYVTVAVSNGYACGRTSTSVEQVPYPQPDEPVEDWFEDEVFDVTGDGHPCGSREKGWAEVVVLAAPLSPDLVGQEYSWEG